jgi:hypothetical protein
LRRFFQTIGSGCAIAVLVGSTASNAQQVPGATTPAPSQQPRVRGQPAPTDPKVPTTVSTNLPGHPSPPQPQQQQGLEYFEGTWNFSWVGRESPITAGPRTGTATFTRIGQSNFMNLRVEGKVDGGGAFKENGIVAWSPDKKLLIVHEKTATNAELLSLGDWSSPLGIRFDTQPLIVQGKTIKLRRSYAILSATSFSVKEELSTDDGPFARLGVGNFTKLK